MFLRHARYACPVFASRDTVICLALILLGLTESRILHAAPAHIRPRTLTSHSALSSYGLSAPLGLWDSQSLRPLVRALGSCPASAALWSFAMPPSLGRG